MSFVHLHTHSEYSLLDGANRIDALVERADQLGMPAVALTDHGNLYGAWDFQESARKRDLRPILGFEAYVAYGDRRDKQKPADAPGEYSHLVVLAQNLVGYHNLLRLSSRGYLEGFYRRPRIDRSLLEEHSEGLIILSACLSGEVAKNLQLGRGDRAKEAAEWYARTFPDRYFLEVQNQGVPGQAEVNEGIFGLAEELGLPVLVTNDAHYLRRDDADAHDTLLCIGTGGMKSDTNRIAFHGQEFYFKSAEEMSALFPDRPDLIETTLAVAEMCDVQFEKSYHLPGFPLPDDFDDDSAFLRHLATLGAKERYGDPLPPEVEERLDYELDVIARTGYAGYFLIVWDFCRAAAEREIPVGPGRGSSAGSIVAYSLRITGVDPLEFDLLFERFLNPERVSMPDIDIDFCFERRGRIIDYVREKYGSDSVGQIITFGTMLARGSIRDVGRVQGLTPQETDRIAKLIPSDPGFSLPLAEAVKKVKELADLYKSDERMRRLLDETMRIEGLKRHRSVHAAGVVIAPGPLMEYVPVCRDTKNGDDGSVITQYDMNALEKAGMLKVDFLGLRTLTVIHDALGAIQRRHDISIDWAEIGLDDPKVYEMLASGGTAGVFQFESTLATEKLRAMRCDRFNDLVAVNALIRPGPLDSGMTDVYIRRKRGFEEVRYPVPELEESLADTYGVITYQEQVMRVANVLAGFSLGEADVLRKAVGKKDAALTKKVLEEFCERAVEKGLTKKKADEIADLIRTFGRYGFPKAHSVAYAVISYRTAWLRAHYPAEFMAALLSSIIDNTDKVVRYITTARAMGLEVLPPSVSESRFKFTVVDDQRIRFGLGAIKGVGGSAIRSITTSREQDPFESLFDFCSRIDLRLNNKRVLECLIASGALDEFGERAALRVGLETALSEAQLRQRERLTGQESLFGAIDETRPAEPILPSVPAWTEAERLKEEKAVLGFYISGHPLEHHRELVDLLALECNTSIVPDLRDHRVELACVVTSLEVKVSKSGNEYCRLTLEDFHGTVPALVFADTWPTYRDLLSEDLPVLVEGSVSDNSRDEENPPIFVDSVRRLSELSDSGQIGICIELRQGDSVPSGEFDRVRAALESSPGPGPLLIRWKPSGQNGSEPPLLASQTLRVAPNADLLAELRVLLGRDRVHLIRG